MVSASLELPHLVMMDLPALTILAVKKINVVKTLPLIVRPMTLAQLINVSNLAKPQVSGSHQAASFPAVPCSILGLTSEAHLFRI